MSKDGFDHQLPKYEAGSRTHMSTAFAPFEDDSAGTILEKHPQQFGGRDVQIGVNAFLFECLCLVRTATCNNGVRRTNLQRLRQLFLPKVLRHKTQNADAPPAAAEFLFR